MHTWKFFRAGGFDQVRLDTGADIAALSELDPKLWVALSCPTSGLEFDRKTLDSIDTDKDGRIRLPELLAAVKRACSALKDPGDLLRAQAELPLAALDPAKPDGQKLLAAAKSILSYLGKPGAVGITVDDTADTAKIFAQTRFNGDGVIPADVTTDEALRAVIANILDTLGPVPDRSGKPGIDLPKLDLFFTEAAAFADWWKRSETEAAILPIGPSTAAAVAGWEAVHAKIDDWFTRSRLAAFDARAAATMNRTEADYAAIATKVLAADTAEMAALPLAHVGSGPGLPLVAGLNPAWVEKMAAFRASTVFPLLGSVETLTAADWGRIGERLAPYRAWMAAAAGKQVAKLGAERIRAILAGDSRAKIAALIAEDAALKPEADAIAAVDDLIRLHRDLYPLLRNFVSFETFYAQKKAVFQAGTLYLDQRACELCIRVEDVGKHSAIAGFSRAYVVYCECVRKATGEKMTIAAALTGGDADNLMVGRNGLFFDRQGRDWDATVVKLVENPISLRQAFWAPYKRFFKFVEDQIASFAASKDQAVDAMAASGAGAVGTPTPAFDVAKFAGVFAAIGLAIGTIGGAIGGLLSTFVQLAWWQMPLAILGIILVISGPSILVAWLKLRQRNLGPLLDASGWAVNTNAKINVPFGEMLTPIAVLPPGSQRDWTDPYAEPNQGRRIALAAFVLIAALGTFWYTGAASRILLNFGPISAEAQIQVTPPPEAPAPVVPPSQ